MDCNVPPVLSHINPAGAILDFASFFLAISRLAIPAITLLVVPLTTFSRGIHAHKPIKKTLLLLI
ncbi:hypothetical protein [Bacillus coahuilensis]|uniref:hypothetical protein n=1 Tax=Bacillus coahuilensis TaxID=408580 RepID=UPI0012DC01EF|nr:hypothetical protein [Bacillus coahuilensis]